MTKRPDLEVTNLFSDSFGEYRVVACMENWNFQPLFDNEELISSNCHYYVVVYKNETDEVLRANFGKRNHAVRYAKEYIAQEGEPQLKAYKLDFEKRALFSSPLVKVIQGYTEEDLDRGGIYSFSFSFNDNDIALVFKDKVKVLLENNILSKIETTYPMLCEIAEGVGANKNNF